MARWAAELPRLQRTAELAASVSAVTHSKTDALPMPAAAGRCEHRPR
jgi:hypothetical protein